MVRFRRDFGGIVRLRREWLGIVLSLVALCCHAESNSTAWIHDIGVSGFAIVRYQASAPEGNHQNSVDFRFVRLSLDGKLSRDFYWKTQFQVNGNTSSVASAPRMLDLFVEWRKYDYAKVRFGQFLIPFTFESIYHPMDVKFMGGSEVIDDLTGYTDREGVQSSNGRDVGVQVQGDWGQNRAGEPLLHYAASLVNGQGSNVKDVDQRKNIVGSLWVAPIKGMRLGVFGWEGSYARKGSWTDENNGEERTGVRSLPQHRYALSAEYLVNDWTFRSEYVHSTGSAFAKTYDGKTTDCSLSKYGDKADGGYACVIAPIKKEKVHVKARWQVYRPAAEWSSAKTQYELGADYMFNKRLWFTASYVRVNDRKLSQHDYNLVDAQLQFRF